MPRTKSHQKIIEHVTVGDEAQMEALYAAKKLFTEIGNMLQLNRTTVSRHIKKLLNTGQYGRRVGSGRKRKTSPQEDRLMHQDTIYQWEEQKKARRLGQGAFDVDQRAVATYFVVWRVTFRAQVQYEKTCVEDAQWEVQTLVHQGYGQARREDYGLGVFCRAWGW